MLEMAEVCKVHVVPVEFLLEFARQKFETERDLQDLVEQMKINPWKAEKVSSFVCRIVARRNGFFRASVQDLQEPDGVGSIKATHSSLT